ncbi:hypothetical protein RJT34_10739 [Clitoria ternatea]|uniref:RING-type domain-containing protein n=1 Tax=Clitoria ternatea TaxID=43366 RepID=A0AAN9JIL6_CLITE
MNSRCLLLAQEHSMVEFSSNSSAAAGEDRVVSARNRPTRASPPSFLVRMAMRISRARWFSFLRRVFHYQNGSRSNLGSNPFNSSTWMMLELIALIVQITITTLTLAISKRERPVWPMRIWISGYDIGCVLNLLLLYGRYHQIYPTQGDATSLSDIEQQRNNEQITTRMTHLMNKCKTSLELFFGIWFVMGNVWVFDSRFGSFHHAPKLHVLCIIILAWNAICYSFPFLLFLLLCCCVPLISTLLGYNMNMASSDRGASDDQISKLPSWRYKDAHVKLELGNNSEGTEKLTTVDQECCICLTKYKDKEEVRRLPCSHMFHQKCVDQWLKITSCCPLCKQGLESKVSVSFTAAGNSNKPRVPDSLSMTDIATELQSLRSYVRDRYDHVDATLQTILSRLPPRERMEKDGREGRSKGMGNKKSASSEKLNCLCSPTTHVGSFRCRHHRESYGIRHASSVGSNLSAMAPKDSPPRLP